MVTVGDGAARLPMFTSEIRKPAVPPGVVAGVSVVIVTARSAAGGPIGESALTTLFSGCGSLSCVDALSVTCTGCVTLENVWAVTRAVTLPSRIVPLQVALFPENPHVKRESDRTMPVMKLPGAM